ncbi:MAG: TlpA disulfide reductase family protein, partial [Ignavibacteriaceae bacterium]
TVPLEYNDTTVSHLLFVFNTACPYCEKNAPNWEQIYKISNNNSLKITGISLHDIDKTKEWINKNKVSFPIVTTGEEGLDSTYKIGAIPQTILVSGNGIVKKVWTGELNSEQLNEILQLSPALSLNQQQKKEQL